MWMHNPPHPGKILREMWLKPLDLSVRLAAAKLGVPYEDLLAIVNERAPLTHEIALRLESAFGKSAISWLRNQAAFDVWHSQGRSEAVEMP